MPSKCRFTLSCLACTALIALHPSLSVAQQVDFKREIAPILEVRCWTCHGEGEHESGLRLDLRDAMLNGGDSGLPAIVPGKPEKSYLLELVNHLDPELKMPPDEDKLPPKEIELLTRWIQAGAIWPGQMSAVKRKKSEHWSFQPIERPIVPRVEYNSANPVDTFLLHELSKRNLSFSQPANPRILLRRASIVLTGLMPTPEECTVFFKAYAKNSQDAYAALVNRLIDSPHFGERWAQHWLDVIRWAETNGSESNMYRKNAWIYRDYVIRAFNADKPYNQFLVEQIAGDAMGQGDATGYLVAGPHVPTATVGREPSARRQARADRLDEILKTVGASALGVTIGCARCHNHKFDPISISDYYSMTAVFQDVEFGSRIPEITQENQRQIRKQELLRKVDRCREQLAETGPWEEDWTGYKELHFSSNKSKSLRIVFGTGLVRVDELEIFANQDTDVNLALPANLSAINHSENLTLPGFPIKRINDGLFGSDAWAAKTSKADELKPWIEFTFKKPHELDQICISSNREDFYETDYLQLKKEKLFEPYSVEILNQNGDWKPVISSEQLNTLNQYDPSRNQILEQLQELISQINEGGPGPSFVGRFVTPTKTYVLGRGSPENPRHEVYAAGLSELGGDLSLKPDASGKERRIAFANWLIDPEHPLTARVAVNRLWHHVFGQGIVSTTSDFGAAGSLPTHPELLDWLAVELMQPIVSDTANSKHASPWSMKHIIRLMVMSDAFRQSSRPRTEGLAVDANTSLLWRFPPRRVEAEVIRDSILQASGTLDLTLHGLGYRIHNVKKRYAQWHVTDNHGPATWRRMIYQERMRRVDDRMFTAFDFPDCGQIRDKRAVSTTPLQALNLMNSDFAMDQSKRIADRINIEAEGDESRSIDLCFQLLLGRQPDKLEREECLALARETDLSLLCRALINSNEFVFLP